MSGSWLNAEQTYISFMSAAPDTCIHVISWLNLLAILGLDICLVIILLLDCMRVGFDFVERMGEAISHCYFVAGEFQTTAGGSPAKCRIYPSRTAIFILGDYIPHTYVIRNNCVVGLLGHGPMTSILLIHVHALVLSLSQCITPRVPAPLQNKKHKHKQRCKTKTKRKKKDEQACICRGMNHTRVNLHQTS